MVSLDDCGRDMEHEKKDIFLLTKPPNNVRANLCFRLIEKSKKSILYRAGDGVYNLLNPSVEALSHDSIYVCKEDMDARGVQPPEDNAISLVDFYEQLIEDMMVRSDKVYAF